MMSLESKHNRHHYHQPTTLCLWVQAQSDLRCRQTDQRGCFQILQLVGADRLSMNWSHATFQALVADVKFNSGVLKRRCLIDYKESPQVMNIAIFLCSMAWGGPVDIHLALAKYTYRISGQITIRPQPNGGLTV